MDEVQVHVHCTKCGYRGKIKLPRRKRVKNHPCPKCEHKTLEKNFV